MALVFQRIAELLAATGTPWAEPARRALTDALNEAFDSVLGVRARAGGRDWPVLGLGALLNATTPLVEATVAIAHAGEPPPPRLHEAATALAEAVRAEGTGLPPSSSNRCLRRCSRLRSRERVEAPALQVANGSPIEGVAAAIRATQRVLAGPAEDRRRRRPSGPTRYGTWAGRRGLEMRRHGSTQQR